MVLVSFIKAYFVSRVFGVSKPHTYVAGKTGNVMGKGVCPHMGTVVHK